MYHLCAEITSKTINNRRQTMTRQERENKKAGEKLGADLMEGFLNFIERHFGKTASFLVNISILGAVAYYFFK
jgi:hypothetical protein